MINDCTPLKPELGQVWTPSNIAEEMAREALQFHQYAKRILDPSCGPATFSIGLHQAGARGIELTCYDIDKRMEKETSNKNRELGLNGKTVNKDYLADQFMSNMFDIIIMNPPYIRHELIQKHLKDSYHKFLFQYLDDVIDKRSNIFALFMLKGIVDLAPNGILCAIVYDAITQSGYGKKTITILNRHAELLISRSIKAPFDDVIVDAQILIYRKRENPLPKLELLTETYHDSLVPLDDLLQVRRGTALPKRRAYLASPTDPYYNKSSPFFVKQSTLDGLLITPDKRAYLNEGQNLLNDDYQVWLKERVAENNISSNRTAIKAVRGSIAFNYYIRNAPRHLLNQDNIALADNFYVSNPSFNFPAEVAWLLLNSDIYLNSLIHSARNQGNGLMKLQLYEYKQVRVPDWRKLPIPKIKSLSKAALNLISDGADYDNVRKIANKLSKGLFNVD